MSNTESDSGPRECEDGPRAGERGIAVPDYDAPAALKILLESEGLAMSKRLGQNFLVNRRARERILEAALAAGGFERTPAGEAGPMVWEVGPGIGSMTELGLEAGLDLVAFEIDHGFARLLLRLFGGRPNFRIVEGDFLRTWRVELAEKGPPALVFGNLPYNAGNAMVAALIEGFAAAGLPLPTMAFTVQKEAAMRMAARPGTKDYSAFSVLCTSACEVNVAFDLAGGSFWPAPRVTSSFVILKPRPRPVGAMDRASFSAFCRAAFSSRRKTARNNLRAAGWSDAALDAALAGLGLSPSARAEELVPERLEALLRALEDAKRDGGQAAPGLVNGGPGGL
jgi:16S rRNA (adenine1518-N6/adenine1519-N6)-dimethyltransferase